MSRSKDTKSITLSHSVNSGVLVNADQVTFKQAKTKGPTVYPAGCIGANLTKRNYVRYLVERYNRFKQADSSFGKPAARFSYAIIFKNVESKFKAPTYFIPEARFDELAEYLQARIDNTILGKRNRARGIKNYDTFDEYELEQHVG